MRSSIWGGEIDPVLCTGWESKKGVRDFPDGPVLRTLCFQLPSAGSVLGQGTKILKAARCGHQKWAEEPGRSEGRCSGASWRRKTMWWNTVGSSQQSTDQKGMCRGEVHLCKDASCWAILTENPPLARSQRSIVHNPAASGKRIPASKHCLEIHITNKIWLLIQQLTCTNLKPNL